MGAVEVYGIGNPLIDVVVECDDAEIAEFGLAKGTMHLIDPERGQELLTALAEKGKRYSCGGSAPNTMIALATFGTRAALGGKIGTDELGRIYDDQLRTHGVVSNVTTAPGPTGTSIIMVTPDSERTMNTHLGTCRLFTRDDLRLDLIDAAGYLYFTGYMWDTEGQKGAILAAIERAQSSDTTIVFDVADPFAVERYRDEFRELIEGPVDVLFANQREAALLVEVESPEAAARRLAESCRMAIVKDGARGSFVAERGGAVRAIDPCLVTPVDTTGAGDMYAGGFLHGLVRGGTIEDAGEFASYVASKIILDSGAQLSKADGEEVRASRQFAALSRAEADASARAH